MSRAWRRSDGVARRVRRREGLTESTDRIHRYQLRYTPTRTLGANSLLAMSYRQAWRQSPPGVRLSRRILSTKDLGAARGNPTSQKIEIRGTRVVVPLFIARAVEPNLIVR